ncbi:HD domain-containing protein [bacterium]|nr:MAG: HD domain-containing protein [bacterium]
MKTDFDLQQNILEKTAEFVKISLEKAESGHDWWHIWRVRNTATHIAKAEQVDPFLVELCALLHDIGDYKFHDGDEELGPKLIREFLESIQTPKSIIEKVDDVVRNISFKGSLNSHVEKSIELQVVQDADRLDAMGAIGIARAFSFSGYIGQSFYDPNIPPKPGLSKEEYKKRKSTSINHFYEKLLLLKDGMNTKAGRALAEERHRFMELYLEQFYKEWDGEG